MGRWGHRERACVAVTSRRCPHASGALAERDRPWYPDDAKEDFMSLMEILPNIQSLPRADKLRLIQFLAQDLAETEGPPAFVAGQSYPVWSPDQAFAAAETLLQTLHAE